MAEHVNRKYHATRRAHTAEQTRAAIRRAATDSFVGLGYARATMRDVADAAGVGERTLYDAFPTKAALFAHTLGVAVVGDDRPVAVAQRAEILAVRSEPDPATAIRMLVDYSTRLFERAGDLIMVSLQGAATDPTLRAMSDAGARATRQVYLAFATALCARGALRPGLDPPIAADICLAVLHPHVHHTLRRRRRWSRRRYQDWVENALIHQLVL